MKTILVFSHEHNTFDKKKLLDNIHPQFVKETDKTVDMFIKDSEMKDFYMNRIEGLLTNYAPGRPMMKPDVIMQTLGIEERRRKEAENNLKLFADNVPSVTLQNPDGKLTKLTIEQVVELLKHLQSNLAQLTELLKGKDIEIEMLKSMINSTMSSPHTQTQETQTQTQAIEQPMIDAKPSLSLEVAETISEPTAAS